MIYCIYISTHKNFTFQLENDRRTVEMLFLNVNFYGEILVYFPVKH